MKFLSEVNFIKLDFIIKIVSFIEKSDLRFLFKLRLKIIFNFGKIVNFFYGRNFWNFLKLKDLKNK